MLRDRATAAGRAGRTGQEPATDESRTGDRDRVPMSVARRLSEAGVAGGVGAAGGVGVAGVAAAALPAAGNAATARLVRRLAVDDPAAELAGSDLGGVVDGLRRGGGREIPASARQDLEAGVGASLADVRLHTDATAAGMAAALHARAFTAGRDVYFGHGEYDPGSASGYRLLAHEVAHTVEPPSTHGAAPVSGLLVGAAASPAERRADQLADALVGRRQGPQPALEPVHQPPSPVVRRQLVPEDVSIEMVGQSMRTTGPFTTPAGAEPAGSTVVVIGWVNAATTVPVRFAARDGRPAYQADVPKTLLQPIRPAVPGIAPYSAGVSGQAASVVRGEEALAAERARPGGPRPGEIPRIEGLQRVRERALNRALIEETMFNRFDPLIRQWTDHYNTAFGYTGAAGLDPDLVKSMIFQESQMGTAGRYLEPVPSSPGSRMARFNIGQVVDTSGPALLIMMEEMEPALVTTHHLGSLRQDMRAAQRRHKDLTDKPNRTPAEEAELATLTGLSGPNGSWENFFWDYPAPGAATGFGAAVVALLSGPAGGTRRQVDYEFWIRTAIRWLFEKRRSVPSWAEAIRAYNGSGQRARDYRDAVLGRAAGANAAEQAGQPYVPRR
jgi:Domain of unknown function (DUF4157)